MSIAIHGRGGTKSVSVISSRQKAPLDLRTNHYDLINLMAYQVHTCYLDLMDHQSETQIVKLTPKEQEILKWLANGLTKSEIGEKLMLSRHIVDFHVRNILKKLEAKNTISALLTAIKEGAVNL